MKEYQKDSYIEWFGAIPDHWEVIKLKYISKEIVSGIASGERDQDGIIQLRTNNVSTEGTIDLKRILRVPMPGNVNLYLLQRDDVIFNNTNSLDLVGKTAICRDEAKDCIFSNHLTRIRVKSNVLAKWVLFQLMHLWNVGVFRVIANVFVGQSGIETGKLVSIKVLLPPSVAEQQSIIQYLDDKIGRIDKEIKRNRRLIMLFNERWRALTHHMITKGPDPSTTLQESGIDWIGSMPSHWKLKRIKHICKITYGYNLKEEDRIPGNIDVYGSNGCIGKHNVAFTGSETIIIGRKGSIGELNYSDKPCCPIDTTYYLDNNFVRENLKWLFYCLACLELKERNQDSAIPGLSRDFVNSLKIPIPTNNEQKIISSFLDRKSLEIDNLKHNVNQQIKKLREYRSTIISKAITGKIDLRVG